MSFLDNIWLLDVLSSDEKSSLELFCQEKNLSSWETLFLEWDEANAMYFLAKWKIEVYRNLWEEEELIWDIEPEEILWEMAIFWWWSKRMASARAVEDTYLITILSFSIKEITQNHPELMKKIEDIIKERQIENKKMF